MAYILSTSGQTNFLSPRIISGNITGFTFDYESEYLGSNIFINPSTGRLTYTGTSTGQINYVTVKGINSGGQFLANVGLVSPLQISSSPVAPGSSYSFINNDIGYGDTGVFRTPMEVVFESGATFSTGGYFSFVPTTPESFFAGTSVTNNRINNTNYFVSNIMLSFNLVKQSFVPISPVKISFNLQEVTASQYFDAKIFLREGNTISEPTVTRSGYNTITKSGIISFKKNTFTSQVSSVAVGLLAQFFTPYDVYSGKTVNQSATAFVNNDASKIITVYLDTDSQGKVITNEDEKLIFWTETVRLRTPTNARRFFYSDTNGTLLAQPDLSLLTINPYPVSYGNFYTYKGWFVQINKESYLASNTVQGQIPARQIIPVQYSDTSEKLCYGEPTNLFVFNDQSSNVETQRGLKLQNFSNLSINTPIVYSLELQPYPYFLAFPSALGTQKVSAGWYKLLDPIINPSTKPICCGFDVGDIFEVDTNGIILSTNPDICPTQTPTPTQTQTPTLTPTQTETPTPTITQTSTNTPTNTQTSTPTQTQTQTSTQTPTQTSTNTPTNTQTSTPTQTQTQTSTNTPTNTTTPTNTPTNTITPTNTVTPGLTPTATPTNTTTNTSTPTNTPTNTTTSTNTPTTTKTPTNTQTSTNTSTPTTTKTPTQTPTKTSTQTPTKTPTNTPTKTPTNTPTKTPTKTPTQTPTRTPNQTPTKTPTQTPTRTPTSTPEVVYSCPATFSVVVNQPGTTLFPSIVDLNQTWGNVEVTISSTAFNQSNQIFVGSLDTKYGEIFTFNSGSSSQTKTVGFNPNGSSSTIDIGVFSNGNNTTPFTPFTINFTVKCPTVYLCGDRTPTPTPTLTPTPTTTPNLGYCYNYTIQGIAIDTITYTNCSGTTGSIQIGPGETSTLNGACIRKGEIYGTSSSSFRIISSGSTPCSTYYNPSEACFVGGFNDQVFDIKPYSTTQAYVSGRFTYYNQTIANKIVRLNINGQIDTTFATGVGFGTSDNTTVYTLAVQSDGKVICGGSFVTYQGVSYNGIIRLNTNGSIDTTFIVGAGFITSQVGLPMASVYNIVLQSDGKILCVGDFTSYNGTSRNGVVRLNSNGSVDTTFVIGSGFANSGSLFTAENLGLQSDGKIIVTGYYNSYSGVSKNQIIRLNSNGSIDTTFVIGSGFSSNVASSQQGIKILSDGKIVILGNFYSYNGQNITDIVRLNSNGTIDNTFNSNPYPYSAGEWISDLSIQSDGKYVLGGNFYEYNGKTVNSLVGLNTDGSTNTLFSSGGGATLQGFMPGYVNKILQIGAGNMVLVGLFDKYNNVNVQNAVQVSSNGSISLCIVPTPTPTPTKTPTQTPTRTPRSTPTRTPRSTPTQTPSANTCYCYNYKILARGIDTVTYVNCDGTTGSISIVSGQYYDFVCLRDGEIHGTSATSFQIVSKGSRNCPYYTCQATTPTPTPTPTKTRQSVTPTPTATSPNFKINATLNVTVAGYIKYYKKDVGIVYLYVPLGANTITDCADCSTISAGTPYLNIATFTITNCGIPCTSVTPTPTPTTTQTPTKTKQPVTPTQTPTQTKTPTQTPTKTQTPTPTNGGPVVTALTLLRDNTCGIFNQIYVGANITLDKNVTVNTTFKVRIFVGTNQIDPKGQIICVNNGKIVEFNVVIPANSKTSNINVCRDGARVASSEEPCSGCIVSSTNPNVNYNNFSCSIPT